jgi:hypothetical protein
MNARLLPALLLSSLLQACAGSSTTPDASVPDASVPTRVYAVASTLSTGSSSTTYVNLIPSLEPTTLETTKALEYPGYSTILGVGGKLLISNAEDGVISRFIVRDDLSLEADGQLSLRSVTDDTAFFSHILVSETKGYFQHEAVGRAVWNPSTLSIVGVVAGPTEAQVPLMRAGLGVYAGYDRATATSGGKVYQPVYWVDGDFYHFAPVSQVLVYDASTDATLKVLDSDCPDYDKATVSEDGTVYFSNWYYAPAAVYGAVAGSVPMCMQRIKAGATEFDDYKVIWRDVSGGKEGAAFTYVHGGKGIVNLFHDENLPPGTDRAEGVFTQNWKFYWFDVETKALTPIEELGLVGAGYYAFHLEGRFFLLVPTADLSATDVYEITSDDRIVKLFQTRGWGYQLIQVR